MVIDLILDKNRIHKIISLHDFKMKARRPSHQRQFNYKTKNLSINYKSVKNKL